MRNLLLATVLIPLAVGCTASDKAKKADEAPAEAVELKADKGVDTENRVIRIGTLNAETGGAASIGKPFAEGKRILAAEVNAGGSGILPEGWTVELVERDHKYDVAASQAAFAEMKDNVLFIGTSFGTPTTLPLIPSLAAESLVVMPASMSSKLAESEFTPPIATATFFEAMRAAEWAAASGEGAKLGIVYQNDDYGQDGIYGLETAAEALSVPVVSRQAITPGDDVKAAVDALKAAGATHVVLSVLPSTTAPVLKAAATAGFAPVWIANTPAWSDIFYRPEAASAELFANFYVVSGFPLWGEESEGMARFEAAFAKYGEGVERDWYVLLSYVQGVAALEAARRAIEAKDITRAGYLAQIHTMNDFTDAGLIPAFDWTKAPYIVSTRTRVLKPDFEAKKFVVEGDWQASKTFGDAAK